MQSQHKQFDFHFHISILKESIDQVIFEQQPSFFESYASFFESYATSNTS